MMTSSRPSPLTSPAPDTEQPLRSSAAAPSMRKPRAAVRVFEVEVAWVAAP